MRCDVKGKPYHESNLVSSIRRDAIHRGPPHIYTFHQSFQLPIGTDDPQDRSSIGSSKIKRHITFYHLNGNDICVEVVRCNITSGAHFIARLSCTLPIAA